MDMPPLDRGAREYRALTLDPTPGDDDALEVSFDRGTTWTEMLPGTLDVDDIFTPGPGPARAVLVAGPDPTANPAGTVVLPVGFYTYKVRLAANPEILVRPGGALRVTT